MANPDIKELNDKATQLRTLADDIASLADASHTFSTSSMKNWSGPHADRTRGEIKGWRSKCATVAENLREEARSCDKSANELKNPKP